MRLVMNKFSIVNFKKKSCSFENENKHVIIRSSATRRKKQYMNLLEFFKEKGGWFVVIVLFTALMDRISI